MAVQKVHSTKWVYSLFIPVLIVVSLVYWPLFWVNIFVLVDFYTPWVLFESPLYDKYHHFLVSRLTEKPEIPLPEISAADATYEYLYNVSHGFTFPVVIRGLLGNTSAVQLWQNHDWWVSNYGHEELLCGTLQRVVENCTVAAFFEGVRTGNAFYISGASEIFVRHPELHDMVDNDAIKALEPAARTATQVFMGLPNMGSDIHAAVGVNIFRMVAGRKKWWFIPPSQTPYLKPSININGFSAHTQTLVGKDGAAPSPWLSKLVRYTSVLNPGDVLVNPPWFWHGILNLGQPGDLVIGSPTRYGQGDAKTAATRNNLLYTLNAAVTLFRQLGFEGLMAASAGEKFNLQAAIANNRRDREKKPLHHQ
eukprot:gene38333-46584_t